MQVGTHRRHPEILVLELALEPRHTGCPAEAIEQRLVLDVELGGQRRGPVPLFVMWRQRLHVRLPARIQQQQFPGHGDMNRGAP
mgnify:CR=1 FL=1